MTIYHGTFTIERSYDASPARVFGAFATEEGKQRWFSGPGPWKMVERVFEFREGGTERLKGEWPGGRITYFDARYHSIVTNERIVYVYDMFADGEYLSCSLATIEFRAEGKGTRLVLTEQGVYFDGKSGFDSREHGTNFLVDKLGAALKN